MHKFKSIIAVGKTIDGLEAWRDNLKADSKWHSLHMRKRLEAALLKSFYYAVSIMQSNLYYSWNA